VTEQALFSDSTFFSILEDAKLAYKSGDFYGTEELCNQALMQSPYDHDALSLLASSMINREQFASAIPVLSKALSVETDNAHTCYNLGLCFQTTHDLTSAIFYYQKAIKFKPDFYLAYNNLGVAYQRQGRFQEANQSLKKAFTINPTYSEAYFNYAQSHQFELGDLRLVDVIRGQLHLEKMTKNNKIYFYFTLAKIYDDLGDFKNAFRCYQNANELKFRGFNIDQFEKYVSKIISLFSADFCQAMQSSRESGRERFIFLLGMPRSGTTLTEQIIASHPQVQSAGEIGFISEVLDDLPDIIEVKQQYPDCMQYISPGHVHQVTASLHDHIQKLDMEKYIITDKSPINFLHIGLIMMLFPKSKIIYCNRNAIDTCLSCFFQNFEKQHQYAYDLKTLALFHNQKNRIMHHWLSIYQSRIFSVNYEDLIANQTKTTQALLDYCELEWDDACLEFYKTNNSVNSASKSQVKRPIYHSSVNKWEKYQPYISELLDNLVE